MAQSPSIHANVMGGFNLSNFAKSEMSNKLCYQFGAGADIALSVGTNELHLMPAIMYITKGAKATRKETWNALGVGTVTWKEVADLHQIAVPIRIGMCFNKEASTRLIPYVGFYFAHCTKFNYKSTSEETHYGGATTSIGDSEIDFIEDGQVKSSDGGFDIGIRTEFRQIHLFLDLEWQRTLTKNLTYESEEDGPKYSSIMLSVGYQF